MTTKAKDADLNAELLAVELELRQLDLEEKRENALKRRAMAGQRQRSREATEASLAETREQTAARQSICPHRKGGKDTAGVYRGTDANMCIIRHTLPTGEVLVLCQRCAREWRRPDKALPAPEYKAALREYREALAFPTDNVDSGSQLFVVRGEMPANAAA